MCHQDSARDHLMTTFTRCFPLARKSKTGGVRVVKYLMCSQGPDFFLLQSHLVYCIFVRQGLYQDWVRLFFGLADNRCF